MKGAAFAGVALLAAGCSSQWYPGNAVSDIARTELVIETDPAGATIVFDGKSLPAVSPLSMPVEYDHTVTEYVRQTNAGQSIRESTGIVGTILLFPIWIPASFFHSKETMKRHEYGGNRHVVSGFLPGRYEAQETVTLEGEAKKVVRLVLPPETGPAR